MLESVTSIVEQFRSELPVGGIQKMHGEGKLFRFACGEYDALAVYSKPAIGNKCVYNDTFPKTVDRAVVYDPTTLTQLRIDMEDVYRKNGGMLPSMLRRLCE
jgi:hypothetical protein